MAKNESDEDAGDLAKSDVNKKSTWNYQILTMYFTLLINYFIN